jgi:hypothetical protein
VAAQSVEQRRGQPVLHGVPHQRADLQLRVDLLVELAQVTQVAKGTEIVPGAGQVCLHRVLVPLRVAVEGAGARARTFPRGRAREVRA